MSLLEIIELFFTLESERLKLGSSDIELPLCLVELVLKPFVLLDPLFEIHPVAGFKVFLDLHA